MGLLDKLLNKDDGHADKETGDWLSKLDEQITESTVQTEGVSGPQAHAVPPVLTTAEFSGPTGNIADHLQTLDVLPGASWSQIASAHRVALENLGPDATVTDIRRINCAYAALRVHGENTAF